MSAKKKILIVVVVLVLIGIVVGTIMNSQANITKELIEISSGAEAI